MSLNRTIVPVYTTRGDLGGFLVYPYIFNPQGEWIGWVASDRSVYSVIGHYVGWITGDPRILRKRGASYSEVVRTPPPNPPRFVPPARAPLPPMMAELTFGVIDVLDEEPELLPTPDFGELRQDLD